VSIIKRNVSFVLYGIGYKNSGKPKVKFACRYKNYTNGKKMI
jgi:hypothetical protein